MSEGDVASGRLPRTAAVIEAGRQQGLHLGCQLYCWHDGEEIELAFGDDRPGVPLTVDALMPWMSSSKPVTAIALGQLWEQGLLALDDPIALHLPEFAGGGKAAITLRHALTHTGGFRMLGIGWPETSWPETIAKICAGRKEPRWEPGEKAGYHAASSWFILGEVVQRLAGRPFAELVRGEIFEPLGMTDSWIGMPAATFRALAGRLATAWDTSKSGTDGGGTPIPLGWESELRCVRASPAGGGRGPMRDLGRFYRALLAGGALDGRRVLTPQTVEALTARHRVGLFDHTFRHEMDWGLGFIPDSKHLGDTVPYAYGRHCSRRTFGHSGYRSSTGFADPRHRLAVAIGFNGLPADAAHERRMRATLDALYADLGLAPAEDLR